MSSENYFESRNYIIERLTYEIIILTIHIPDVETINEERAAQTNQSNTHNVAQ